MVQLLAYLLAHFRALAHLVAHQVPSGDVVHAKVIRHTRGVGALPDALQLMVAVAVAALRGGCGWMQPGDLLSIAMICERPQHRL